MNAAELAGSTRQPGDSTNSARHLAILAILMRIWGALALIVGLAMLLTSLAFLALLIEPTSAPVGSGAELTAGAFAVIFAMLGAFALGWGGAHVWAGVLLRRRHPHGRSVTLALAVANLLMLPFGTALGGYALWILLSHEGRQFFEPSQPA